MSKLLLKHLYFVTLILKPIFSNVTLIDWYLNFAPWPQDEVRRKCFCFSVTSKWGRKQIILLLRDINIRSRENIFVAPWPQDEVTRKYFCFSMTSTWGREQIILLHPNCSKGALFCNFNSETYFSKVTKIDCYLNFAPWPQCEVANKYLCCSVTSRWDHEKIFLFLHDLKMRWRTNNFVAPWPQHEVTRKYFCCSVTSRWGHEKIFFFLRDLNMRSRTNIFVFLWP